MSRVTIKDINRIPDVIRTIRALNSKSIEIGVFGSDDSFMAMLASVHEFGLTIKAKKRFLTIPTALAGDKKARDFTDLRFVPIDGGRKGLLVRDRQRSGKVGARSEIMFILVPSVTIPERSFIRSTTDTKQDEWSKLTGRFLADVLDGKMSVETFYERLGAKIVGDIQEGMRDMEPENAPITRSRKKSSSPLIDTGRLRQSVTWKVVSS